MDQRPLVTEQIDAGNRFLTELAKSQPVLVAFWLKGSEEETWYLYVVSDEFKDKNINVAYGEVLRIAGQMKDPNFDPFQVKLIASPHPLAEAALITHQRYPTRIGTRYRGKNFGGMGVDEVYLYPPPVHVPVSVP